MLEVDDTATSGASDGEAKGDVYLEVEDDLGSVGQMCGWAELLTELVKKNMTESIRWDRKIGERILTGQNEKEKIK
jgi:hypothetical protein